jgi:NADH-quinone oxidoreductase subunit L
MTIPLVILAALATVAGVWNLPHPIAHAIHAPDTWFDHYLEPSVGVLRLELPAQTEWMLMAVSVAWALAGLALGYAIYKHGPSAAMERIARAGLGRIMHTALYGKWFIDEVYEYVVIKPLRFIASAFAHVIDPWIIDGLAVKGSGYSVLGAGKLLSKLQTGNVQSYAFYLVIAIAAVILWSVQ